MPVNTIFIVMMENRSFDHLLGYLSLTGHGVEGIRGDQQWLDRVASIYNGSPYPPFRLNDPYDAIAADPPHARGKIAIQIGTRGGDTYPMKGFVESYATALPPNTIHPGDHPPVMGYFTATEAPVTDFLARNFAVCDHWHAALPAGTQPNRLMAMSGYTLIDENKVPLPKHELVYDWLTAHGVSWRVYHENIPFFALMPNWIDEILAGDRFRPLHKLYQDVEDTPPEEFPQVVFIEPVYCDAPHLGESNDDHSPAGIKGGQGFLLEVYRAVSKVPDIWNGSVLIVTYDEHGGFFDHVSPPLIRTDVPAGAFYKDGFASLGVRVPALVISPFVQPGTVHSGTMDHTSILKYLGEKFGRNGSYSPAVDHRPVESVSAVLNNPAGGRRSPVMPSLNYYLDRAPKHAGRLPGTRPRTDMQVSFQDALDRIRRHPRRPPGSPYPELLAAFPPEGSAP